LIDVFCFSIFLVFFFFLFGDFTFLVKFAMRN